MRRGNLHIHALRLYDFIHWENIGLDALDGSLRDVMYGGAAQTFLVFDSYLKYKTTEHVYRALSSWYDTLNERYTILGKRC